MSSSDQDSQSLISQPGAGSTFQKLKAVLIASLALGLLFYAPHSLYAQDLVWAKRAGGPGGDQIAVDGAGNSYVTGGFSGSAIFGPGETNETTLTSAGFADIFVAKYDAASDLVWAKRAGGTSSDNSLGIDFTDSKIPKIPKMVKSLWISLMQKFLKIRTISAKLLILKKKYLISV